MNAHISDDKHKTVGTVATMTAAAQELGTTTATRANEAATVVGEKIGSLATLIRENAPHEGAAPLLIEPNRRFPASSALERGLSENAQVLNKWNAEVETRPASRT